MHSVQGRDQALVLFAAIPYGWRARSCNSGKAPVQHTFDLIPRARPVELVISRPPKPAV